MWDDPNEQHDADIMRHLYTEMNIVLMALETAQSITPQRKPFREVDAAMGLAIAAIRLARAKCEDL